MHVHNRMDRELEKNTPINNVRWGFSIDANNIVYKHKTFVQAFFLYKLLLSRRVNVKSNRYHTSIIVLEETVTSKIL